ncbi:MAG TPA: hypothetical protein PLK94_10155 [Alphaproteobacteria bacterium]|jgi:ABC-type phosphate transport system auxiliary subunit|nr:hypothetical protein [Alphaproteobacteria bacterium]
MNELQTVKRKILLKRQAVRVINDEIRELRFKRNLLQMKADFERQIGKDFDKRLSHRIDAVRFLLEN